MEESKPSRTALGVALRRASHQIYDSPRIFEDPLAMPIIARYADRITSDERMLRLFVAARSRFAEDRLTHAYGAGTRQYVLLGAGLDTFAYRNPHEDLRVFEVDHPATQAWKRRLIAEAAIAVPASCVYVPVDFEKQKLEDRLAAAGFDGNKPAFFAWLGVVPYLTEEAFRSTLAFIASIPRSGVVFDYGTEAARNSPLSARVARIGEPFRLFFEPENLHRELRSFGFGAMEDLGCMEINQRFGLREENCLTGTAGRIVWAEKN